MLTHSSIITRQPEHPGFDTLGSENRKGEDYLLLVDGREIGGTYYCDAADIPDGQHWASWGPAGYSMGHRTREDAERVQVDAHLANPAPAPRNRTPRAAGGLIPRPRRQTGTCPATTPRDLAERVSQHMQQHFPDTVPAASWTVARDERDNTAVVVAGPGSDPTMPGSAYAIHAYRWLCSLRDSGFTAEARTDMEVFGRPDEEAPGGRARWLHITGWDPDRITPERGVSQLAAELRGKLGLPPTHFVRLNPAAHPPLDTVARDAVRADLVVFAYLPDGGMDITVHEEGAGYPVGAGREPDWLREIGEAHRAHGASGRFSDWCYMEVAE